MHSSARRTFLSRIVGGVSAPLFGLDALAADERSASNEERRDRPLIGAIRWDAWYDPADGAVARAVEKTLGPAPYHRRMPFFGRVTGTDSVRIDGYCQEIIDREIEAAANAGIDFWAFDTYPPDNPVPWEPQPPPDHYYQPATPDEIARHLEHAVLWLKAHRSAAPANAALVYAWNECSEGFGALVPTHDAERPEGDSSRLEAIASVLMRP